MVKKGAKYWKSNTKQLFCPKTIAVNLVLSALLNSATANGAIMPQISSTLYFHGYFSVNFNTLAFGMAFALPLSVFLSTFD